MPAPLDVDVHIEAASFRGRPVLYNVYWPWTEPPSTSGPSPRTLLSRAADLANLLWGPVILVGGGLGLLVVMLNPRTSSAALDLTTMLIVALAWLVILMRFGLLTLMVGVLIQAAVERVTITLEPSSWYAGGMLLALTIVFAIAAYSFWVSLGGKPLFADGALEPWHARRRASGSHVVSGSRVSGLSLVLQQSQCRRVE